MSRQYRIVKDGRGYWVEYKKNWWSGWNCVQRMAHSNIDDAKRDIEKDRKIHNTPREIINV